MSGRNPWLDDDDSSRMPRKNRWLDDDDVEDFDPHKDYFTQTVAKKENNMLESTQRSIRMLDESERVGAATGEELVRQGEVLRRTEQRVDKMEQDLKESDRHLRSIKSLWGAFMNKFSKEPPSSKHVPSSVSNSEGGKLQDVLVDCNRIQDEHLEANDHPVLNRQQQSRQLYSGGSSQSTAQSSAMQQVDENLDLMGQSLSRLKALGLGMQNEIETQDPIIERLHGKVERVDEKIHKTNREMIKLNHS